MIATHDAAMAMMQAVPHRDGGIHRQESGLTNGAKLMKLFAEQVEVYQKLKGQGTQQRVTVEHVHIHEGGQAMVGNFEQPIGGGGGVTRRNERNTLRNPEWLAQERKSTRSAKSIPAMRRADSGWSVMPFSCNAQWRCRIHGGLSTGARTEDGKQRIRRAVTTHGLRTKESLRQRGMVRRLLSEWAHLQKLLQ